MILLFGLTACNNRSDKSAIGVKTNSVHVDSAHIDSNEVNVAGGESDIEFRNCNFDYIIANQRTPTLAKDIYLDNDWNLSNSTEALALLDSLTAKNKTSRAFYFKVVTMTYKNSDGYFSEGLGHTGYNYVLNNTKEFATYFENKECFTDKDLETWADIVLLEIQLEQDNAESTDDEHIVYSYCRKLNEQSELFTSTQKQTIKKYTKILEEKWGDF